MKNNSNVKLDDFTYSSTSDSAKNVADIWKEYYENGQIWFEVPYKKGKRHGISKLYYENGQLEWELPYKNGERHGMSKKYHINGQLLKEETWFQGRQVQY